MLRFKKLLFIAIFAVAIEITVFLTSLITHPAISMIRHYITLPWFSVILMTISTLVSILIVVLLFRLIRKFTPTISILATLAFVTYNWIEISFPAILVIYKEPVILRHQLIITIGCLVDFALAVPFIFLCHKAADKISIFSKKVIFVNKSKK